MMDVDSGSRSRTSLTVPKDYGSSGAAPAGVSVTTADEAKPHHHVPPPPGCLPRRHFPVSVLFAACFLISYVDRSVLSIAIIPASKGLDYTGWHKGFILGAFYYGYVSTQIIAAMAAKRFGPYKVLAIMVFIWSLFTGFTALCFPYFPLLLASRVIVGLAEGFGHPCVMTLVSYWSPYSERSTLVSILFGFSFLGNVLAMLVTPFLIELLGWRWVFYLAGLLGVVWLVFWVAFGSDRPSNNRWVSKAEAEYIEANLTDPATLFNKAEPVDVNEQLSPDPDRSNKSLLLEGGRNPEKQRLLKRDNFEVEEDEIPNPTFWQGIKYLAPWKKIMTSSQIYAVFAANFATHTIGFILSNWMPSYLTEVHGASLEQLAYFTPLPYVAIFVMSLLVGVLADRMRSKGMHIRNVRKIMNAIGLIGPGLCTLGLALWPWFIGPLELEVAVAFLTAAFGFNAFVHAGFESNFMDLSPKFAGIIFSVSNTIGTTAGLFGVPLVGILVGESLRGYNFSFLGMTGVCFVATLINVTLGGPR
eukprot:TRINITY_DN4276_c0_g1_i6.p1 TRINITY_DN4276_c0_g1~~TRINITY_DN4276_c0_g1_i6.p1  ORF type:complete len:529 (-),score=122.41 TRINITY_DN4276_c0_g1_i6:36-1622(-)